MNHSDRNIYAFVGLITILVCAGVALLVEGPRLITGNPVDVSWLPRSNALMNALTTVLILGGYAAIKSGNEELHKRLMMCAFVTSAFFFVGYVFYHLFKEAPVLYTGPFRKLYLSILISHIVLAVTIVPLVLLSIVWGLKNERAKHKKIVRYALPIWLYVSVTGVVVYLMLRF